MPNRLARATSPYLQQHAENPVDWQEWGEAALAQARAEQKPIFLSIGYSTCHWCHVMAHESFEAEAIAQQLNTHFVPIKVDREERPDLDRVYMTYVQALTGHGGWPLSVWLTPELKPFFGGTYFPPEDRPGRPGLPTVLRAITDGWAKEREKLVAESQRVIEALALYSRSHYVATPPPADGSDVRSRFHDLTDAASDAFERCYQYLYENFDQQHGGFGGAPKFPRASNLDFLFRCAVLQGRDSEAGRDAVNMATTTLRHMAEGGIHDVIGGGFHRYAVDEAWQVPHFEKMLYDQAQIAVNLIEAHQFTTDERYAWVARGVLDYVLRDLTHSSGAFFAAEDADSPTPSGAPGDPLREGAFYLWTRDELERVLGVEASWFCDHYGVQAGGNVPEALDPHGELRGGNLLRQQRPWRETARAQQQDPVALADRLVTALERLRAVRAARPRPHRDEKIITAWNGLMISAFARAAASTAVALAEKAEFYREAAEHAADFLQREVYDEATGLLYRTWRDGRGPSTAFAEDYAALIAGLLDLYEAGGDVRWLRWADRLQQTMNEHFWDAEHGGFFQTSADDASIVLRLKEDHDGAEPAANSLAGHNLFRLGALLHDERHADRGRETLLALRGAWTRTPWSLPAMLGAVERGLEAPRQIVLTGRAGAADLRDLLAEVRSQPRRRAALVVLTGAPGEGWLTERMPALAALAAQAGRPARAYVCEGFTCQAPVSTRAELAALLAT